MRAAGASPLEPHHDPLARLPYRPEAGALEELGVAHVVPALGLVRIRLERACAIGERMLGGCVEEGRGDPAAPAWLVHDEADERPDGFASPFLTGSVLGRAEERREVLAGADGDPADGVVALVGEESGLTAGADELSHRAFLRLAVLQRAIAPVHAPAAVRGDVTRPAARAGLLEEGAHVAPPVRRDRDDAKAHETSSSRGFSRSRRPNFPDGFPSVVTT